MMSVSIWALLACEMVALAYWPDGLPTVLLKVRLSILSKKVRPVGLHGLDAVGLCALCRKGWAGSRDGVEVRHGLCAVRPKARACPRTYIAWSVRATVCFAS